MRIFEKIIHLIDYYFVHVNKIGLI